MKILITSYYELRESLLLAAKSLEKHGNTVISYPLYQKYNDKHSKIENYKDDFIKYIQDNNPDVILWWYIGIPTDSFGDIVRNTNKINIFFNWDEPHNHSSCDLKNKAQYFDIVFVTCKETLSFYLENGTTKAICLYPGFSPEVHQPLLDKHVDYECDISICCTNLYDNLNVFPNQYIVRKELVDTIYKNQKDHGYKFHIYGPEGFKRLYPESYKGFVRYNDTTKVFNYSKINICTHTMCDKGGYLNERVFLILGSGGLLFIDDIKDIDDTLQDGYNCVKINKERYIEQICDILKNYNNYIKIRKNGYIDSKKYTWDKWAENINNNLLSYISNK